jgi:hypothetical protein
VDAAGGTLLFLPFTALGDEQYSTYIRVS